MSLITWKWNDLIFLGIIKETYTALLFGCLTTLGSIGYLEFCVVKVGDELGRCGDPSGLLLLAGGEENYRYEAAKEGANAAAL